MLHNDDTVAKILELYRAVGHDAFQPQKYWLGPIGRLEQNRFLLRAVIDGYQLTVFSDGRAIISGTYDLGVAKSLYARYVGH